MLHSKNDEYRCLWPIAVVIPKAWKINAYLLISPIVVFWKIGSKAENLDAGTDMNRNNPKAAEGILMDPQ